MRTRITLEIELEIDFSYDGGSPSSWVDDGQPDAVTLSAVTLTGHRLPLSAFCTEDREAMEEAAFAKVRDYCPVLDS